MKSLLPLTGRSIVRNPTKLKYLLIAPPKWGKTTFFSGVPGVVLLAFEAGYSDVDCPKVVLTCWDRPYKEKKLGWEVDDDGVVYCSATELIEEMESNCPYSLAIIDTLDMATKMASDYYCEKANVTHPSEGGDWGRGFDILQTRPIRMFYSRLVRLGIGVACITHSTEKVNDKFAFGKVKRETSLPGKVQGFAHTQSDLIMHGFYSRRRQGQKDRDRFISFDGTDYLMAGTRIRKVYIPNKYIVTPPTRNDDSPPWKQWETFFTNNPDAGKLAEKQFVSLYRGRQDESIEDELTETTTKQNKVKDKAYVEEETNKRRNGNKILKKAT